MTDQSSTGSADASGEQSGTPEYQAKYNGLNAVLQRKTNEWSAKERAWLEEREQLLAAVARGAEYEAREAAERAEAEELAAYEQLREKFETEPPAPSNPNATNYAAKTGWDERYPRRAADTAPKASGFPT